MSRTDTGATAPPPPAPEPGPRRPRRFRGLAAPALVLAALAGLTAWNLTRSDALDEADRAYTRGDLSAALSDALDHLRRRPWSTGAARVAALCFSRLDFADEAEPYYRRGGDLSLDDLQVRAYGLVRGNHRKRAVAAFHEILERWPENVTALRRLAAVELSMSNDPELLRLAGRLVEIPGGAAIGHTLFGVVQQNQDNPELAVPSFEKVLELDPELKQMPLPRRLFWGQLVGDLLVMGRFADARKYLNRALTENPDPDPYLMTMLGRAYYMEGAVDEAERCYRKAIELDPTYAQPYQLLGKVELGRKGYDEALSLLRRAVALGPGDRQSVYALATAYRLVGRTGEADALRKRFEELRAAAAPGAPVKGPLPRYAL